MAKIIDPDNLELTLGAQTSQEIVISTSARTIEITSAGTSNIDSDGVTLQCVYSFLKEEWKSNSELIKYPFPFISITEEQFELVDSWNWATSDTLKYIKDGGWALKDVNGVSLEEYMNITTLGSFNDSDVDTAYYIQQLSGDAPIDTYFTGEVNQAIKIYGSSAYDDFDYRDYFKVFLREQAKNYDEYDLLTAQNLTTLKYKKYTLPLSNSLDTKITHSDAVIASASPYTSITIEYYTSAQPRDIGTGTYYFNKIIDGNNATKEQIYEKIQYLLRQNIDIDSGSGVVSGSTADKLLTFIGDTLRTSVGVYIDNFAATDTNSLIFTDTSGTERTFPYVAAGSIVFNENLISDSDAYYWMYFTDANGNQFGTTSAILVEDNNNLAISGAVSGQSQITFDFDYDNNVQGGRTSGTDAAVTVVAIGLQSAQYVKTTSTITRSIANNISLVSSLERNYDNP